MRPDNYHEQHGCRDCKFSESYYEDDFDLRGIEYYRCKANGKNVKQCGICDKWEER